VIHENINLILNVLSKEINGLRDDLREFTSKMVCKEDNEACMMSRCQHCEQNFKNYIMQNILDKKKSIKWYQWITYTGRVEKREFSGKNKLFILFFTRCVRCF
jgi:hypothetical protein